MIGITYKEVEEKGDYEVLQGGVQKAGRIFLVLLVIT